MRNTLRSIAALFLLFSLLFLSYHTPALYSAESLKEALFYQKLGKNVVQCYLCPRNCVIPPGKRGYCRVRENRGGTLFTFSYGRLVSATSEDPIEKKPLFHFLPGSKTFSIATAGCNLKCKFCQNWEISQACPDELAYRYVEPDKLVAMVKESGRNIIAYTYTEPTIFYEYMLETAKIAKAEGLKNIMHSCGYINEEPLRMLAKYLDAANIDLKGFNDEYYLKMSEGTLEPVLKSLKILKEEGVYVEITNLILSGYNDDNDSLVKMCLWIKDNLGADTPIHFSRAFPMYLLTSINPTPPETLIRARQIALDCGLKYAYIGNMAAGDAENTYCPRCKKLLIERKGYFVVKNDIVEGKCEYCEEKINGIWI